MSTRACAIDNMAELFQLPSCIRGYHHVYKNLQNPLLRDLLHSPKERSNDKDRVCDSCCASWSHCKPPTQKDIARLLLVYKMLRELLSCGKLLTGEDISTDLLQTTLKTNYLTDFIYTCILLNQQISIILCLLKLVVLFLLSNNFVLK